MEKLDTLIAMVVELRTSVRYCSYAIAVGISVVVLLMSFALAGVIQTTDDVDRLSEQTASIEKQTEHMNLRLGKIQRK
jgi:hypothetical protein